MNVKFVQQLRERNINLDTVEGISLRCALQYVLKAKRQDKRRNTGQGHLTAKSLIKSRYYSVYMAPIDNRIFKSLQDIINQSNVTPSIRVSKGIIKKTILFVTCDSRFFLSLENNYATGFLFKVISCIR